jgi:hypothetical protein
VLRDAMNEPFFWGAQGADAGYELAIEGAGPAYAVTLATDDSILTV